MECHYDANLDPDTETVSETTDNFMYVVDRVTTPALGYILQ